MSTAWSVGNDGNDTVAKVDSIEAFAAKYDCLASRVSHVSRNQINFQSKFIFRLKARFGSTADLL